MQLDRRQFLQLSAGALPMLGAWRSLAVAASQELALQADRNIIPAPTDPAQWPAYRAALERWRIQTRDKLHYNDALYHRPDLIWSASNYACAFLMMCDETFYDWRQGRYRVEQLLAHGQREFGGYDSVVLWHAYPRIGIDQRNQFDFYRDQPGGLSGVRSAVRQFHHHGVKVYLNYNPWDTGTRREPKSDLEALAAMVSDLEADGIFLDTLDRGQAEFRALLDAVRPGVILESEGAVPLEQIGDHQASWAQWFDDSLVPGVLRHKWLERHHMQHQVRRWDHDHTAELQSAWMNGSGMMVWENVFGSWMPWNERDRSILRAMLPIQRRFTAVFQGDSWTPLVPTVQPDVFASLWEKGGVRLWTLVNRAATSRDGVLLKAPAVNHERCFDLVRGTEIKAQESGSEFRLTGHIPARGIGCFVSGPGSKLGADFDRFLRSQRRLNTRASTRTERPLVETRLRPVRRAWQRKVPPGMVELPPAKITLRIDMRVRECGFYESMQPAGDSLGEVYAFRVRMFQRTVETQPLAIDETPVTNAQFSAFLEASGYRPGHAENFLRHWRDAQPPAGKEDHPVVYVGLEDARAYAAWAGKRLPTEEEWQYAAQGTTGWKYPWGDKFEPGRCNAGESAGTTPVKAFPLGRSPFGCYDMCGNVWEWTESERGDSHTRFCVLRGGSSYIAQGSGWYADGGPRPVDFAEKFLLSWPGLDRCATIGFRCVVDLRR